MRASFAFFGILCLGTPSVSLADDETLWDQLEGESGSEKASKKKKEDSKPTPPKKKKQIPPPLLLPSKKTDVPKPKPALIDTAPALAPKEMAPTKVMTPPASVLPNNRNTAVIKEIQQPIQRPSEPQIIFIEPPPTTEELVRLIPKRSFDLPMNYHERVIYWTEWFKGPGRHTFAKWREESRRYKQLIAPILKQANAPSDLFYLPMIESGFNPLAESSAGAAGLWQFMPKTARRYGLKVDLDIDERKDPLKSTKAAIRLLKRLRLDLGYWHVALAAYNAGPGRVSKAMRKHGTASFWTLADEGSLPEETRDYVPKLLAVMILDKHSERFDLPRGFKSLPFDRAHHDLTHSKTVFALAKAANMTEEDFRALNPHVLGDNVPASSKSPITIYVPPERIKRFVSIVKKPSRSRFSSGRTLTKKEVGQYNKKQRQDTMHHAKKHRVKSGENLASISKQRGISIQNLRDYNELKEGVEPKVGALLRLIAPPKRVWKSVQVKSGDTLRSIAKRHGCSVGELRRWNGLSEEDSPSENQVIWLKPSK